MTTPQRRPENPRHNASDGVWEDERLECPGDGCWRPVLASELCEHNDPDTGPLCWTCCQRDHHDNRDPLGSAA